jgi:hypothetical protein
MQRCRYLALAISLLVTNVALGQSVAPPFPPMLPSPNNKFTGPVPVYKGDAAKFLAEALDKCAWLKSTNSCFAVYVMQCEGKTKETLSTPDWYPICTNLQTILGGEKELPPH